MSDYTYYDKEPKNNRNSFLIVVLIIVAIVVAGALVVQYVLPKTSSTSLKDEPTQMATSTPAPTPETIVTASPAPEKKDTDSKLIPLIENGSIADIVEYANPTIVGIKNYVESVGNSGFGKTPKTKEVVQGSGSGVIISEDGLIVTNHHVIDNSSRVTVTLNNGEEYNAKIIGSDEFVDLAVLKIEEKGLKFASFGDSKSARQGELAIAIGYPLSDDFSSTTVTAGILSAVGKDVEVQGIHYEMIQIDAPINPGNSGGALLDGKGQLIGINTLKTLYAGATSYGTAIAAEGIGYAIPIHVAEPIIKDLIEVGEVVRPFIGVKGRIVTKADSEYYQIPRGLYVDELTKNGPAEKAGIKVEDIITHVNGEEVEVFQDIFTAITSSKVGDKLEFTIYRQETDKSIDITVILESSEDY
jgi:serine protease Do